MFKKFTTVTMLLIAAFYAMPTVAGTITSLYGDKDGFGTGAVDGDMIWPWDVLTEFDDEGFTDIWVFGNQSWSQTYDVSSLTDITSASLTLLTGGQGIGSAGATELYIDGLYVADLTDGQTTELASYAREDVFDLTAFASLLDGATSFEVRTFYGFDAWVLDYSELAITGTMVVPDPADPGSPVSEPATLTLLGLGLIGLVQRKRGLRA